MSSSEPARPRLSAALREGATVTPLELFFDLVFVLAITECTSLMAADPTWAQFGRALLVLAVLWWSWVGYAWLTSLVDPEEGWVRLAMFAAMAGLLVVALCIPEAFGDLGLLFAGAYAVVRLAHIGLFMVGARGDPALRRSVIGLFVSTFIGVSLLVFAAFLDGPAQGLTWAAAVVIDMAGPYVSGSDGWRLEPEHFAERHGLIVLIALGESIVAIGLGAQGGVDAGVVVAAVVAVALAAALWWMYFDVVALVAARRLQKAAPGRERNEVARDSFSYLHFPMVAGIVMVALGVKTTLAHVGDPLHAEPATALLGGIAMYMLAHVAFRWRNVHRFSAQRFIVALVMIALIPAGAVMPALATLAMAVGILAAMLAYEVVRFAELRGRLRHDLRH